MRMTNDVKIDIFFVIRASMVPSNFVISHSSFDSFTYVNLWTG